MTYDEAEAFPERHTLKALLIAGSKNPDLDEAVLGIQAAIGVPSGDYACMCFSDLDQDGNDWLHMSEDDRYWRLWLYAVGEVRGECELSNVRSQQNDNDDDVSASGGNIVPAESEDDGDGVCYVRSSN